MRTTKWMTAAVIGLLSLSANSLRAYDEPSYNGFLPQESGGGSRGTAAVQSTERTVSPTTPVPAAADNQTPQNGQWVQDAAGNWFFQPNMPPAQAGHFYVVERWQGERFATLDHSHAAKYAEGQRLQGHGVSAYEYYEINNGQVVTYHIVDVWQWKPSQQTDNPQQSRALAQQERAHNPHVRVVHYAVVQPAWYESQTLWSRPRYASQVEPW